MASLSKPLRRAELLALVATTVAAGPAGEIPDRGQTQEVPLPMFDARVLVVKDQPVNSLLAVAMIEAFGCRADIADDGRAGVEAVLAGQYDLVLMDCHTAQMDGFEATQAIRGHEAARGSRRVPITALTANAVAGDQERCLAAGMDGYLCKPFTRAQLAQLLLRWLALVPGSSAAQPLPDALFRPAGDWPRAG